MQQIYLLLKRLLETLFINFSVTDASGDND